MSDFAKFRRRDQRQPGWFFVDNEIIDKYTSRIGAYGVRCTVSSAGVVTTRPSKLLSFATRHAATSGHIAGPG